MIKDFLSSLKKLWKDPVFSNVLATIIASFFLSRQNYAFIIMGAIIAAIILIAIIITLTKNWERWNKIRKFTFIVIGIILMAVTISIYFLFNKEDTGTIDQEKLSNSLPKEDTLNSTIDTLDLRHIDNSGTTDSIKTKDVTLHKDKEILSTDLGSTRKYNTESKNIIVRSIFICCTYELKGDQNDAFSKNPNIICDIITQALSEKGYNILDNPSKANYILTLASSTSLRSNGEGKYSILSYYANVKGEICNQLTDESAFFNIFNDPDVYDGGKTPKDAATKAFNRPALKEKIIQNILPQLEK